MIVIHNCPSIVSVIIRTIFTQFSIVLIFDHLSLMVTIVENIIDKIDGFKVLSFNVAYVANDRIVRTHGCN